MYIFFYTHIQKEMVCHNKAMDHFLQHSVIFGKRKSKKLASIFWTALVWEIWNSRNEFVFNGKVFDVQRVLKDFKARVWSWCSLWERNFSQVSFTEWSSNAREFCWFCFVSKYCKGWSAPYTSIFMIIFSLLIKKNKQIRKKIHINWVILVHHFYPIFY